LTSIQLDNLSGTLAAITGIDSILDDGHAFGSRWADAQEQVVSARWRGHPNGPVAIAAATKAAIKAVSLHVNVSPSSVNFFADKGVLQVTVVSTMAVPIHDVHLSLTPAQPRLRIEQQPQPLKIGAKSRTNVPLHVTAIAAGLVRVEAVLTTANGTPLGQNARVDVRVQPTSTWIYWVLGGLAGLVLVLGSYRSLRRGSTRASRPDAAEPALHD
jgi:mRNA-degrading endonuclease toxin of MazEF toxin-antitoxin module